MLPIQIAYYTGLRIGKYRRDYVQSGKEEVGRLWGFPFSYAETRIHKQSAFKQSSTKGWQELLGHADVSTTMNIYAHATREAKRTSARLLDKIVGGK